MGECVLTRRSVVKNEYELLADITVSSATTNVDITGLNLVKGEEYVLVGFFVRGATSSGTVVLYCDDDDGVLVDSSTSYYFQSLIANGNSLSSSRVNANAITFTNQNTNSMVVCKIKVSNSGYVIFQSDSEEQVGASSMLLTHYYMTSTFITNSITKLRLAQPAGIGIGSRFQLYKVAQ